MKAQTLADFIAKMTPSLETSELAVEEWKLWTYGAYGAGGFGIEIPIKSYGNKVSVCSKARFNTSNNVAEYEAVIMTLRIIAEIGI